jgi:hypothetical protein
VGDSVALVFVALSLLMLAFVLLWTTHRGKQAFTTAAREIRSRPNLFAIPLWLLPFGLAVVFEAQTRYIPDVLANTLFFIGRFVFPLSYTYKLHPEALEPLFYRPTHAWDLLFWCAVSVAYWYSTRNIRPRYAFAAAPLVVAAILATYHLCAWQLGYVHWGLPTRVVG